MQANYRQSRCFQEVARATAMKRLLSAMVWTMLGLLVSAGLAQQQTLTVWHYFSVDQQVQLLEDLGALFNEAHPDVTVEWVFVPYDQLPTRVIAAAGAGTGPDVVVFNGPNVGDFVEAGAIMDMSAYWEGFAARDEFSEAIVHQVDGQVYAVQGYVNLLGLWYNQDILEEVGIEPPETIDELSAALESVVAAGFEGITLTGRPNDQGEWQAYPWLSAHGWTYEDPQQEACEASFALVTSWVDGGALSPIVSTWEQVEPFQAFLGGNVAFTENGNWQLGTAQESAQFNYGVVPMPQGPQGTQVYLGGEAVAISTFSGDPDLAWAFLEVTYYSEEGQLLALRNVGSIPSRADAAADPLIAEDPILSAFAYSVQNMGATYPPPVGPITQVRNAQLVVGQQWSAVISGQSTPSAACATAIAGVQAELR
jgi:multiple sugar transport system substrate-binding protein